MYLMLWRLTGRAFRRVDAATLKDLSPNDFSVLPDGCIDKTPSFEHSVKRVLVLRLLLTKSGQNFQKFNFWLFS